MGESSGLSVVSVSCLFMVSCFLVRLRLFRKPLAQKLGLESGKNIVALGAPGEYGRRR